MTAFLDSELDYEVINNATNESHGTYATLDEARGCVEFDRLRYYTIWQGDTIMASDNSDEAAAARNAAIMEDDAHE